MQHITVRKLKHFRNQSACGSKFLIWGVDTRWKTHLFSRSGGWPPPLNEKKKLPILIFFFFNFQTLTEGKKTGLLKYLSVVLEEQCVKPTSHLRSFSFKNLSPSLISASCWESMNEEGEWWFFSIFIYYWSTFDLQCCISFWLTAKWFIYIYIHIHICVCAYI